MNPAWWGLASPGTEEKLSPTLSQRLSQDSAQTPSFGNPPGKGRPSESAPTEGVAPPRDTGDGGVSDGADGHRHSPCGPRGVHQSLRTPCPSCGWGGALGSFLGIRAGCEGWGQGSHDARVSAGGGGNTGFWHGARTPVHPVRLRPPRAATGSQRGAWVSPRKPRRGGRRSGGAAGPGSAPRAHLVSVGTGHTALPPGAGGTRADGPEWAQEPRLRALSLFPLPEAIRKAA